MVGFVSDVRGYRLPQLFHSSQSNVNYVRKKGDAIPPPQQSRVAPSRNQSTARIGHELLEVSFIKSWALASVFLCRWPLFVVLVKFCRPRTIPSSARAILQGARTPSIGSHDNEKRHARRFRVRTLDNCTSLRAHFSRMRGSSSRLIYNFDALLTWVPGISQAASPPFFTNRKPYYCYPSDFECICSRPTVLQFTEGMWCYISNACNNASDVQVAFYYVVAVCATLTDTGEESSNRVKVSQPSSVTCTHSSRRTMMNLESASGEPTSMLSNLPAITTAGPEASALSTLTRFQRPRIMHQALWRRQALLLELQLVALEL